VFLEVVGRRTDVNRTAQVALLDMAPETEKDRIEPVLLRVAVIDEAAVELFQAL